MFGVPFDLSNKGSQNISSSGKEYGVRRYPFPQKEFELNRENVTAAQALLGGTDNAATMCGGIKRQNNLIL